MQDSEGDKGGKRPEVPVRRSRAASTRKRGTPKPGKIENRAAGAGSRSIYRRGSGTAGGARRGEIEDRPARDAGLEHALERDRRKSGQGRLRVTVLSIVLALSLAALLWVYTCTGVLNVRNIEVRGNEVLSDDYVTAISGITVDTHLLKINVEAVDKAVSSDPYVREVEIERRFPATVILNIEERTPEAMVVRGGNHFILDGKGFVLDSVTERPQGLVELRGLDVPLLYPGLEIEGREFTEIMALLGSMTPDLGAITEVAGYLEGQGLYLVSGGVKVIYGEASDLSRKNAVALMAIRELVGEYGEVEYIDVSLPENPVIKPA